MRQDRYPTALGLLLELVVLLNEDMTRSLARDGLTVSRAGLLWRLLESGPSPQQALANTLGVSPRTVTGLIDALVATGFVTREPHPGDRRATLVTFTPHGLEVMESMRDQQVEFTELLFGDMSDARFDGLVDGLADVLGRIRAHLPPVSPA
jgi:DNA-binding MarR family transcriptional regulator